jgi:hypothetical protein
MAAMSCRSASIDRLAFVERIKNTFARSPIFRGAAISEPLIGPTGDVAMDVSFDGGPTVFRVVAASEAEACAILHELALAMVEVDREATAPRSVVPDEPEWARGVVPRGSWTAAVRDH